MNRKELQEVLMHLRREGPQAARVEEITHIQAGLEARLGCSFTAEEALWLWERFLQEIYGTLWLGVDDGTLDLCVQMVQSAVRRCQCQPLLSEQRAFCDHTLP